MPFVRIPGLEGKVFVPGDDHARQRKHRCPDCFQCQMCGEGRCKVCRNAGKPKRRCSVRNAPCAAKEGMDPDSGNF